MKMLNGYLNKKSDIIFILFKCKYININILTFQISNFKLQNDSFKSNYCRYARGDSRQF